MTDDQRYTAQQAVRTLRARMALRDLTVIIDPQMPPHTVYVLADGREIRVTVAPAAEDQALDALHKEIRQHVVEALAQPKWEPVRPDRVPLRALVPDQTPIIHRAAQAAERSRGVTVRGVTPPRPVGRFAMPSRRCGPPRRLPSLDVSVPTAARRRRVIGVDLRDLRAAA